MTMNTEQFTAANKATVDSLLSVANTALASAERIANLNLDTVRSVVEDTVSNTKAMLAAKDPKEALSIQTAQAQPSLDKAVAYSRSLYEISNETKEEFTKMFEAQFGGFQKSMTEMLEKAAKSAPAGSEVAVNAFQSAIAAANTAFGNMSKTAKQMTDLAQSNIATATTATAKAAKKA